MKTSFKIKSDDIAFFLMTYALIMGYFLQIEFFSLLIEL